MKDDDSTIPSFGGVAGRVLREALAPGTLLSGLSLVFTLGILGYLFRQFEAGNAHAVLVQIAVALTLARFARNGLAGEWGGTLFHSTGGSWLDAGRVAVRFAALSSVWLIPVWLLGWRPAALGEAFGQAVLGGGGGMLLGLTTLVITLAALTPPVFLIAAVGAEQFLEIFLPRHWRRLFSGRMGDLFLVYTVYLGGLGMILLLLLPIFAAVAFQNVELALFLGFFALSFTVGLSLDLLGRLSGFFAASAEPELLPEAAGLAPTPEIPGTPARTSAANRPLPAVVPLAEARTPAPTPATPSGKPPLLEARGRVEELEERLTTDPHAAIEALRELHAAYAPNPIVVHRLCLALAEHGRSDESIELAREALPLCLERGALRLAAQIFALHHARAEVFGLPRDTVLALALDLRRLGDLDAAERAFAGVFDRDRGERRAVKGLIQVAEDHLKRSDYPEARRVYRFLAERAGDSPFEPHIRNGLAEAERRLAKAS